MKRHNALADSKIYYGGAWHMTVGLARVGAALRSSDAKGHQRLLNDMTLALGAGDRTALAALLAVCKDVSLNDVNRTLLLRLGTDFALEGLEHFSTTGGGPTDEELQRALSGENRREHAQEVPVYCEISGVRIDSSRVRRELNSDSTGDAIMSEPGKGKSALAAAFAPCDLDMLTTAKCDRFASNDEMRRAVEDFCGPELDASKLAPKAPPPPAGYYEGAPVAAKNVLIESSAKSAGATLSTGSTADWLKKNADRRLY